MRIMVAMDILTIASSNGGAGNTTLTAHPAVEAERGGACSTAMRRQQRRNDA
jgi:cellulose biosynthesis protein BcsQ